MHKIEQKYSSLLLSRLVTALQVASSVAVPR